MPLLRVRKTRFGSLSFWATCMNTHVGTTGWYIAGGMAAFLRIEGYADKDADYYSTVRDTIAPADIEIGVLDTKVKLLADRYGAMTVLHDGVELHIDVQPQPAEHLALQIMKCSTLDEMNVYSASNLVSAYAMSSNPLKADKRKLRVGMLKLLGADRTINQQNMQSQPQTLSLGAQLAAFKFKPKESP